MKVKDLIEQLNKFNPEIEVIGSCTDPTDYTYTVPIESVELDSPYDSNGYSGVDGSESEDDVYDDEGDYIGPRVVVINLGVV